MSLIDDFDKYFGFEDIEQFKKNLSDQYSDDRLESLAEKQEMRKRLIQHFLIIDTYENRLEFIFNFQFYFNFFSEYPIEGFGKFSGYPTNEDQRLIFIDFLIKYIGTETIFFENIEEFYPEFRIDKFHLPYSPLSRGLLGYASNDQIISEIQFFSEDTTFSDQKKKWTQEIYEKVFDYNENYTLAADFFYKLYKGNKKFEVVIKEIDINKSYLFYYTIFYRPIYEPYIQLLQFLEELKYNAELWDEITLSKVYFKKGKFSNTELSNKNIYEIAPDGRLICLLPTQSRILLIENLLKTPISKQEYKTIYEILLNFESEVESIAAQSTNLVRTNFIKVYVEKLNANITSLSSKELKSDFYINFIKFIINENFVILSQSIINELVFHLNNLSTQVKPDESPSKGNNIKKDLNEKPKAGDDIDKKQKLKGFITKRQGFTFRKKKDQKVLNSILDDHHDLLFEGEFINRCKTDFKAAFNGKTNFNKIIWKKSFPELRYYIKKLSKFIENKKFWVIASTIFLNEKGKEFTNIQLSKTKRGKKPISEHRELDEIFDNLCSTLDT